MSTWMHLVPVSWRSGHRETPRGTSAGHPSADQLHDAGHRLLYSNFCNMVQVWEAVINGEICLNGVVSKTQHLCFCKKAMADSSLLKAAMKDTRSVCGPCNILASTCK